MGPILHNNSLRAFSLGVLNTKFLAFNIPNIKKLPSPNVLYVNKIFRQYIFIFNFYIFIKLWGDDSILSLKEFCGDKICRHQLFLFIYLFSNKAIW